MLHVGGGVLVRCSAIDSPRRLGFFRLAPEWCLEGLMTSTVLERTVMPPDEPLAPLVSLLHDVAASTSTTLLGPAGERLVLPAEVFDVLRTVVDAMAEGQAVTIVPVHQRLTAQEAAELLGISRPTLVKLLERGEIPFEQPGRHRRVRLADVIAYRDRAAVERRGALERMVAVSEDADMYERTATVTRMR
jgi:excisionase family DNA binding protein